MRKSPTSSVPSGKASRFELDAGLGLHRHSHHGPRLGARGDDVPRDNSGLLHAVTTPAAPAAARNGRGRGCRQYCGGTMGSRDRASRRNPLPARVAMFLPSCSFTLLLKELKMAPADIFPAALLAMALWLLPGLCAAAWAAEPAPAVVAQAPAGTPGAQKPNQAPGPAGRRAHLAAVPRRGRGAPRGAPGSRLQARARPRHRTLGVCGAADGCTLVLPRAHRSPPQGACEPRFAQSKCDRFQSSRPRQRTRAYPCGRKRHG